MKLRSGELAILLVAAISAPAMAQEYEITYSGTMNGGSINAPLAGSFYGGESFSGTILFNSSAVTSTSGPWAYTAGEDMTLSVGPIYTDSAFTISRAVDLSPSDENYYYFDNAFGPYSTGPSGSLSASGYTLTRSAVSYQVPYAANPSLFTSLITTQAQINAGFPEWTLYMQFNSPTDAQQIFGTVTTMTITPVPEPATAWLMLSALVAGLVWRASVTEKLVKNA